MGIQIVVKTPEFENFEKKYSHYDKSHAGPFDRGSIDSYYYRPPKPHYYTDGSKVRGTRVPAEQMTADEIEAYNAGYEYNELMNFHKDWG